MKASILFGAALIVAAYLLADLIGLYYSMLGMGVGCIIICAVYARIWHEINEIERAH